MSISLRAQVIIDLKANDFASAADHQRSIEDLMTAIRAREMVLPWQFTKVRLIQILKEKPDR